MNSTKNTINSKQAMKKILSLFFLVLIITSCNDEKNQIQGDWAIDELDANFSIKTNGLNLKKDYTCELPMVDISERHTDKETGTWSILKKKNSLYLMIKTKNTYFNKCFKIENLKEIKDSTSSGCFVKMTLVADSIIMNCTKVLY